MSLSDTYKAYIVEKLMMEYLYQGIVPTSDMLEDDLVAYMQTHPDLTVPLSKQMDFTVERGSSSSSSKIEEIALVVSQDVGVLAREIYRLTQESSKFYDRWSAEAKRLSSRARQLEHRIDSLLLLNNDTAGFFSYVGDTFSDTNRVDLSQTTARINVDEQSVSLSPYRTTSTDQSRGTQLNLTELTEEDISFYAITNRRGTTVYPAPGENSLINIFKTDSSSWGATVTAGTTGEMVCELKARFSYLDKEVSKVSFTFTAPIGSTSSTVSLQYSVDGYKWFLVPAVDATKVLTKNMAWTFPITKMKWVKFIFNKAAPDEGTDYKFEVKHMRIFGDTFSESDSFVLISKSQQSLDNEDNPIKFSQVSLDCCYEVPNDTGIQYFISASKDNNEWSDWMNISPSDFEGVAYPKIINIGGVSTKDNTDLSSTTKFDVSSGLTQKQLTRTFNNTQLTGLNGYNFKDSNFAVVNTAISISTGEDPDPIANSLIVWRNVRYKDLNDYPDTKSVRSVARGWGFDGGQYSCYFEVIKSEGILLDFGGSQCIIDDVKVSGIINVPKGIHKFITDSNNWFDITDNLTEYLSTGPSSVGTEEVLQKLDPLYPYNHKLIIEGFPYAIGSSFKGEKAYLGTDISAEFYARKVSLFDLENNSIDYGTFSVRGVGNEEYPTLAVVTNFNISNPDYTNEHFVVKWRAGEAGADMYSYVKLKAEFWTNSSSLTPILTSYRIKLGI